MVGWLARLSGHALRLISTVCPTFILNSFLTLSWVTALHSPPRVCIRAYALGGGEGLSATTGVRRQVRGSVCPWCQQLEWVQVWEWVWSVATIKLHKTVSKRSVLGPGRWVGDWDPGVPTGQTECLRPAAGGIHYVYMDTSIFSIVVLQPAQPERTGWGCWWCLCSRECSECLSRICVTSYVCMYLCIQVAYSCALCTCAWLGMHLQPGYWLDLGTGSSSSLASLQAVGPGMICFPLKILFQNTVCWKMTRIWYQKGYFSNSEVVVWQFVIFCRGIRTGK